MNFYRTISFIALSIIFSSSISSAQSSQQGPFELNLGKEATIISAGAVVGAAAFLIMSNNSELTEDGVNSLGPADVNSFDRIAIEPYQEDVLGDVLLYGSFFLPLTFLTYEGTREELGNLSLMYGEVVLVNAAINGLVKGLTTRNRPYVYDARS